MKIKNVLFDMGGTIEDIIYTDERGLVAAKKIVDIFNREQLPLDIGDEELWDNIKRGISDYRKWSEANEKELPPEEIWSKWHLKDLDISREAIEKVAEEMAVTIELGYYNRNLRPGVIDTLEKLKNQGIRLGVISNTASKTQVFMSLKEYGIDKYFEHVCLSSICGWRKPNVNIFKAALETMDCKAEESAYVGDTRSRDVIGPKNAGFALAIQIKSFMTTSRDKDIKDTDFLPDYEISSFSEVYDIIESINNN